MTTTTIPATLTGTYAIDPKCRKGGLEVKSGQGMRRARTMAT